MKTRMLTASVVAFFSLLGLTLNGSAQAQAKEPPGLVLKGELRDIAIEELIRWTCEYTKMQIIYQRNQVKGTVTLTGPNEGVTIEVAKFPQLLADALDQFSLVLMEISPSRFQIVSANEAISYAPVVDVAAARKTPGSTWITCQMPVRNGDANAYRAALQNLMSRRGGSVSPVHSPPHLVISDRADRVWRIIDLVEAMELEGSRKSVASYEVPGGINPEVVARALSIMLPRDMNQEACAAVGSSTIFLRGSPEAHAMGQTLLKKLGEKAPNADPDVSTVLMRYETADEASAPKIAQNLAELFRPDRNGEPTFAAIPGAKAFIARARPSKHAEIKQALELMK